MRILDEATLVAYVDGELDPATAREVERAVAEDDAARALLDDLVSSAGLVRSAFAAQLSEPVPERLLDAVRDAPGPKADAVPGGLRSPWWARSISALAASVVLVAAGFGSGVLVSGGNILSPADPAGGAVATRMIEGQKLFNGALENELSGTSVAWTDTGTGLGTTVTPVKTYRRKQGGFCREYRIDRDTPDGRQVERGIACRAVDGRWVPRYATVALVDSSI